MLPDGFVRVRSRRAEIRDAQRLLERKARRHRLAKDLGDSLVGERPGIDGLQAREHLRLALGAVRRAPALERADRLRVLRSRVETLEDLEVERVDGRAVSAEVLVAVAGGDMGCDVSTES